MTIAPRLDFAIAAPGLRTALVAVSIGAAGLVYAAGDPAAFLRADPALGRLLQGMAALKALMALAICAALYWRFKTPIGPAPALGYLACAAALWGGAAAIWRLSFLGETAIFFHAALIGFAFIALKDQAAFNQGVFRRR